MSADVLRFPLDRAQAEKIAEDQWWLGYESGKADGWTSFHQLNGLHDCTIKNTGTSELRIPVGRREAYVDLAPGEEVTLRTVHPQEWWKA